MTRPNQRPHGARIDHLCRLARLTLSPEEASGLSDELDQILAFVATINRQLPPAATPERPTRNPNQWRSDEPRAGLNSKAALANAASTDRGYFTVPKILGDEPGAED